MQNVVLYTIFSHSQTLCSWVHPQYKKVGLGDKIISKLRSNASVLLKKWRAQQYWVYYFSQDEFLFVLAAAGSQVRDTRMKNYLKVIADIFYQIYDERKFPTVLNYLMIEINRIESTENNEDELDRLTNNNTISHKQRFNLLIREKSSWSRTYKLSIGLVICILLLFIYYVVRRYD